VERFEYFRHLERIAYGKVPPESLLEVREVYDTYFRTSPAWDAGRPGPTAELAALPRCVRCRARQRTRVEVPDLVDALGELPAVGSAAVTVVVDPVVQV
jgi:hypothetical protein